MLEHESNMNGKRNLIDRVTIQNSILKDAKWAESHGADPQRKELGAGLLYYTIAYLLKAKVCVCIGSGGGFVPRLMRQAQRDLELPDARTILIDADTGEWCRPDWMDENSFFRREFSDIEIITDRSSEVFKNQETKKWSIDYLHIDGDHSYKGSLEDFEHYATLMSPTGIITFHDTKPYNFFNVTCWKTLGTIREGNHKVIDLPWIGSGTAIIQLSNQLQRPGPIAIWSKQYIFNFFSTIRRRMMSGLQALLKKFQPHQNHNTKG